MVSSPTLWLVAGPNGVGKTTYAFRHIRAVSGSVHFINLDEIARGLSPLAPDCQRRQAGRFALAMARSLTAARQSFTIETTLAGRTHLRTIAMARGAGFLVNLLFFAVATPDICLARVARRVSEGGHDVPEADVRRRFGRGIANFPRYAGIVDLWRVLNNSDAKPRVVAEGRRDCVSLLADGGCLPPALNDVLRTMPRFPA
jgi:predicted ABC-type ATPase